MKKLLTVFAVAGMFTFIACGPSAEEQQKMEQARQDSIKAVEDAKAAMEKARQDSINEVMEKEKAKQDSISKAKEDSIAKAKDTKTSKPAPKKPEVKAGQGKG